MKIVTYIVTFLGVLALAAGIALLLTFPLMWGINWVFAPQVLLTLFGTSKLTFWKTFVLDWVIATLFKGYSTSKTSD